MMATAPRIRMLDCCDKVLVPVLWHHDARLFTMAAEGAQTERPRDGAASTQ